MRRCRPWRRPFPPFRTPPWIPHVQHAAQSAIRRYRCVEPIDNRALLLLIVLFLITYRSLWCFLALNVYQCMFRLRFLSGWCAMPASLVLLQALLLLTLHCLQNRARPYYILRIVCAKLPEKCAFTLRHVLQHHLMSRCRRLCELSGVLEIIMVARVFMH